MFLSAVWTLILTAPIHYRALVSKWCNVKFLQICSDEETNWSTSWMAWGWIQFQQIFIFVWTINYSFKSIFPQTPVLTTLWFQLLRCLHQSDLLPSPLTSDIYCCDHKQLLTDHPLHLDGVHILGIDWASCGASRQAEVDVVKQTG